MDFVVALFVFPALVALLATGAGLLVDRVAGEALPGVLIPPIGLALLVVVAELCTYPTAVASSAPVAVAVVGVAGFAAGLPRLRRARADVWPLFAAVAVYLMSVGPVLL